MIHAYISLPPPDWKIRDLLFAAISFPLFRKEQLEARIEKLYGVPDVMLTNLGRTALIAGLKAAGLAGKGVLIPTLVCPTVIHAVLKSGCRPVLADIEKNLHISDKTLEAAYTQNVNAVLMPHLYGLHSPVEEIREWAKHKKLFLIDDAAQAVGLQYKGQYLGRFGDMGILSFGPSKSIGISRGGVLMSHDAELIARAKKIPPDPEPISDVIKRLISCIVKLHYRPYFLAVKEMLAPKNPSPFRGGAGGGVSLREEKEDFALSRIEALLIFRVLKRVELIFSRRREIANQFITSLDKKKFEPVGAEDIPYVRIPIRLKGNLTSQEAVSWLRSQRIEAEQIYMPLHLWDKYRIYADKPLVQAEELWNKVILVPNPIRKGQKSIVRLTEAFDRLGKISC
jgi:dTDP-4-amino-4,6-dideoxygalactose transaminase